MKTVLLLAVLAIASAIAPARAISHSAMMSAEDLLRALAADTVEGAALPLVIKALHQAIPDLDRECDAAEKLVVTYHGENARIYFVLHGRPCAVVRGPADPIRRMLHKIQGQPV